jgi:ribonuclease D
VDWGAVAERRGRAEWRIAAMEAYAAGRICRRRALVGYFGERLNRCAGCDRCRRPRLAVPHDAATGRRLARLRAVLSVRPGPWGCVLLEPEVMLALARHPPESAAALADVPGVGPTLASRYGRVILEALGPGAAGPADSPETSAPRLALEAWRRRAARAAGVPDYVILGDAALAALLAAAPTDARALATVPGVGPRVLAKYGDELLGLIAAIASGRYLVRTDQGEARPPPD